MPTPEEINEYNRLNKAFLKGDTIPGVKFRHNSVVTFPGSDGARCKGWIVAVGPIEPEPVYTIERSDGGEDEQVLESNLELILDPHEDRKP